MILKIKVLLCKCCSCVFNFLLRTNNILFINKNLKTTKNILDNFYFKIFH